MFNGVQTKYYAGIGARETPPDILGKITGTAHRLNGMQFILRSGGARGADSAWQNGAGGNFQLYKPESATEDAIRLASKFHPNWKACSDFACRAHGRNMMILFGYGLNDPVDFVACWTPDGKITGGTGQAIRAAEYFGIPVFNFALEELPDQRKLLVHSNEMTRLKSLCHTTINRSNAR